MAENKTLDDRLELRIESDEKEEFVNFCSTKLERPWQNVMRDIVKAFNERRLQIKTPGKKIKLMQEIYKDAN